MGGGGCGDEKAAADQVADSGPAACADSTAGPFAEPPSLSAAPDVPADAGTDAGADAGADRVVVKILS